jgi:hypothetical protein
MKRYGVYNAALLRGRAREAVLAQALRLVFCRAEPSPLFPHTHLHGEAVCVGRVADFLAVSSHVDEYMLLGEVVPRRLRLHLVSAELLFPDPVKRPHGKGRSREDFAFRLQRIQQFCAEHDAPWQI